MAEEKKLTQEQFEKLLLLPIGINEKEYSNLKEKYIRELIKKGFEKNKAEEIWHKEFIENYKKYGINKKLEQAKKIKVVPKKQSFFYKLKKLFQRRKK